MHADGTASHWSHDPAGRAGLDGTCTTEPKLELVIVANMPHKSKACSRTSGGDPFLCSQGRCCRDKWPAIILS